MKAAASWPNYSLPVRVLIPWWKIIEIRKKKKKNARRLLRATRLESWFLHAGRYDVWERYDALQTTRRRYDAHHHRAETLLADVREDQAPVETAEIIPPSGGAQKLRSRRER